MAEVAPAVKKAEEVRAGEEKTKVSLLDLLLELLKEREGNKRAKLVEAMA